MENFEREVTLYVRGVVQERLANDPNRLNAFRNVVRYIDNNRGCPASQRYGMIRDMFGYYNQDLAQMFYTALQDQYDFILLNTPPQVRYAKLYKVGMMCFCIQFMDLFRQCFSIHTPFYTTLSNAVHMYTIDQIPEAQLRAHVNHVLLQFPDFANQLQTRISRITTLVRVVGGSGGGPSNNPGAGNPPPQV